MTESEGRPSEAEGRSPEHGGDIDPSSAPHGEGGAPDHGGRSSTRTAHSSDLPVRTPYELIGGADAVRRLVEHFYDLMDSAPEAARIRSLHADSLRSSREKLYLFLTGWLGGPPLYMERYGHPRLRARHLPFAIGERERDEWLWCMDRALDAQEMPSMVREFLRERFRAVADHMRNQPRGGPESSDRR